MTAELDRPAPPSGGEPRRQRVLLIEDDDDDVVLVADQLDAWPEFDLVAAASVAEALARMTAEPVDCVLLDLNLPDARGLEGLDRVLAHAEGVAVVVLTGDRDTRRGAAAVAAGAQDFLVKGQGDADTLVRAIRYAIERRASAGVRLEMTLAHAYEAENNRLQRGLLPEPIVRDGGPRISTAYQPGHRRRLLGGDFYDAVQTSDGVLHAIIGDVAGHGPDEAALGVRLRMAWRTLVFAGIAFGDLLGTVERVLEHERHHDSIFTTAVQVCVSADQRRANVQLAGHPPPILLGGEEATLLPRCEFGPALGIATPGTWPMNEVELDDDWALLLYTDGWFEGRAAGGPERLGLDGLLALVRRLGGAGPMSDAWLERLLGEVTRHNDGPLVDDVAALGIGRPGTGGRTP